MKRFFTLIVCTWCIIAGFSQVGFNLMPGMTHPPMFGPSPFQDSLWGFDTTTHQMIYRASPTLAGFTITGMTGLTMHPHTGEFYIIMKVSGVSGRVLGTFNPTTGVCSQVGNLGDNFSTISFREDGQLFGVTGDGALVSETMYLIDHTNGTKTLAASLGAGADGEVIAYNYDDDFFYHWSGYTTVVFEKIMSTVPYTTTTIPIIGTPSGETFGAAYLGGGRFRISNISSNFNHCFSDGTWTSSFGSNPDDLRGLGMVARWVDRPGDDTICANETSLLVAMATPNDGNRHKFQWVRNGVNIPGATNDSLYANVSGWYNCRIILDSLYTNGQTMDSSITAYTDTAWYGRRLTVLNIPNVTISPSPVAYLCNAGDSVLLTGSSGGSSQWYANGVMMAGATANTYYATTPGVYNMVKTNLNGCSDSAATGTSVLNLPISTMTPTGSSTVCNPTTVMLAVTSGADSYQWLRNDTVEAGQTNDTIVAGISGTYECIVTYGTCVDTIGNYQLTVLDCSGIEENSNIRFKVYPNPVHEKLNISNTANIIIKQVDIVDLTGRKVISNPTNSSNVQLDVLHLKNGTYLITIITDKGTETKRFVKH